MSVLRFAVIGFCGAAGCLPPVPVPPGTPLPFNFHVLEDGKAYRSAQPTHDEVAAVIQMLGVKTVLNLRGSHPGTGWYDEEAAACSENGATLVSVAMSAQSMPPPEVLAAVIQTLQTAEYPILIHCKSGADRTGGTSAIYRMLINGWPREQAMNELSPIYFHFRQYAPCMDVLMEQFQTDPAWLQEYASTWESIGCGTGASGEE